jgi:hypothetical protein
LDGERFDGAPGNARTEALERRRIMGKKDNKKDKKIDAKAAKTEQKVKPAELSEQDLDKVAGGATYSTSRSNIRGAK